MTRPLPPAGLKDLYSRRAAAIRRRPAMALASGHARARAADGLACDVVQADLTALRLDLPLADGGTGAGPQPEQLLRAALAGGLAMGYRLWAARLDVPLEAVEVDLSCEHDQRGQLGVDPAVPVGWQRVVIDVILTSRASEGALEGLVDEANRRSLVLANLSPQIERVHRLTIVRPALP
jgi:uncharacterized OsmC-like protein